MTGFTQEQLDAAIAAAVAKATKDAQDAAAPNFAASQAELATLKSERQAERIGVQVTGWKAKGLVTPAEEPGLREFMAALEGGEATAFSFSAADKSAAQKTPAQFFADFMALRQPVVKLGQQSPADDGAGQADGNANDISDRARSYMKAQADKGLEVSVSEAVAYVSLKKA